MGGYTDVWKILKQSVGADGKLRTDAISLIAMIKDGIFAADATSRAKFADGFVTKAKAKVFVSAEVTGNGTAQSTAHGLAAVPAAVLVAITLALAGECSVSEGTHTSTNVIVTATTGAKYKIFAWA